MTLSLSMTISAWKIFYSTNSSKFVDTEPTNMYLARLEIFRQGSAFPVAAWSVVTRFSLDTCECDSCSWLILLPRKRSGNVLSRVARYPKDITHGIDDLRLLLTVVALQLCKNPGCPTRPETLIRANRGYEVISFRCKFMSSSSMMSDFNLPFLLISGSGDCYTVNAAP